MPKTTTCGCGADLSKVPNRVYHDDTNEAINNSARPQCVPCFAATYMRPVAQAASHDALFSADAMSWLAIDQGRYPRSSYVVLATPTGSALYR